MSTEYQFTCSENTIIAQLKKTEKKFDNMVMKLANLELKLSHFESRIDQFKKTEKKIDDIVIKLANLELMLSGFESRQFDIETVTRLRLIEIKEICEEIKKKLI